MLDIWGNRMVSGPRGSLQHLLLSGRAEMEIRSFPQEIHAEVVESHTNIGATSGISAYKTFSTM